MEEVQEIGKNMGWLRTLSICDVTKCKDRAKNEELEMV